MSALVEARESLSYWESRLDQLPRTAVRKRREAREMVVRWRERVDAAERAEYGPGFLGALFLLMAEKRLPTQASRQIVRVGKSAAIVAATAVATMVMLTVVLFDVLLALIF
ncbi:hypothetical protein DVA67_002400 [Solirubrobacter sp. CPCC 204708]|uniref:DUF3040 domain-containing protein n=1 Tax=Solirubrobacter deserti TaxID=2282478 RepID=A0ABT4RRJ6_9ACTN|nr:hypothetical protein [Solirubrobacter deserti]MBE2314811.1 hypothetical protein [Solirubrobacter deserti]MDA0141221.1 hypothetical protein [Solirubrobacter deserti]